MHQEIPIYDTSNGMILARSVYDSNNNLLAKEGSVLTPALISIFKKRNITNLSIKTPIALDEEEYAVLIQNLGKRFHIVEKNNWLWEIHKVVSSFYKDHLIQ